MHTQPYMLRKLSAVVLVCVQLLVHLKRGLREWENRKMSQRNMN